jgi:AmiR/NasT family two-component response regulator
MDEVLSAIAKPSGETFDANESTMDALGRAHEEIDQLKSALATRALIGQATGLLMRDRGLTADQAFAHLIELSSHTNVKLREIAAELVAKANGSAT